MVIIIILAFMAFVVMCQTNKHYKQERELSKKRWDRAQKCGIATKRHTHANKIYAPQQLKVKNAPVSRSVKRRKVRHLTVLK